jgi:PAB1-binding protein PBP1
VSADAKSAEHDGYDYDGMMGQNASGSVPNEGIMNTFAGRSTEQHNNEQGGNSNTQE